MSWLTGIMKAKHPDPKEGMRVDLKTGYAVMASGEIVKVRSKTEVRVHVTYSGTSLYGIGFEYEANLSEDGWNIVREDAW